ncbi:MAG: dh protein [Patescibacteria group bacterium]|nr:dh protein [Patescibacteria group bacterium]
MSFILKKPHTTGSIAFSPIFCAPGALGFFREGYPWHRVAKLLGMTFEGTSFVAKTATLHPLVGNMPLKKDGLTPKEIKPKCIEVYPRSGHVLNAVGLSNMGFWKMFFDGRWQAMREPFMLSFMPKGNTVEEKVAECQGLVHDFLYQYYQRPYGRFSADFAWQVNFACPNTGTDPACFIAEVPDVLKAFQPLRLAGIPIVANFNALVPLKALLDAEDLCDAYWIANTIPWGTPGIDWTKFTSVFEDGKPVSPLRGRGIPADGGLSGPDCFHFTLAKLEEAVKAKVRLPIIAGNGLQEPDQVNLLRAAGASAIAIGSVALVRPWRTGAIIARAHEVFGNQAGSKRKTPLGGKISGAANQFPSY